MHRPRVIYIAGYGRSGSTVLDIAFGRAPGVHSCGELGRVPEAISFGVRCTCGESANNCAVWSSVSRFLPEKLEVVERPAGALRLLDRRQRRRYAATQGRVIRGLRDVTVSQILVDSTKTARQHGLRPLLLSRLVQDDVLVVHLARDLESTLKSLTVTGSNRSLEADEPSRRLGLLRVAAGWAVANAWATVYQFLPRIGYVPVSYGQLVESPDWWITRILAEVGVSEPAVSATMDGPETRHLIGGNRVRMSQTTRINPLHRSDTSLGLAARLLVLAMWPIDMVVGERAVARRGRRYAAANDD